MLPRLSGSGCTCETKVTEVASCSPAKKRSDGRAKDDFPFVPLSALRRAIKFLTFKESQQLVVSVSSTNVLVQLITDQGLLTTDLLPPCSAPPRGAIVLP